MNKFCTIDVPALTDEELVQAAEEVRQTQIAIMIEQGERAALSADVMSHLQTNGGDYESAVSAVKARREESKKAAIEARARFAQPTSELLRDRVRREAHPGGGALKERVHGLDADHG